MPDAGCHISRITVIGYWQKAEINPAFYGLQFNPLMRFFRDFDLSAVRLEISTWLRGNFFGNGFFWVRVLGEAVSS